MFTRPSLIGAGKHAFARIHHSNGSFRRFFSTPGSSRWPLWNALIVKNKLWGDPTFGTESTSTLIDRSGGHKLIRSFRFRAGPESHPIPDGNMTGAGLHSEPSIRHGQSPHGFKMAPSGLKNSEYDTAVPSEGRLDSDRIGRQKAIKIGPGGVCR